MARLGWLLIVAGVGVVGVGIVADPDATNPAPVVMGVVLAVLGLLVLVAVRIGLLGWSKRVQREGIEGTGEVIEVRDTRTSVNKAALFEVVLMVSLPDDEPYRARAKILLPRHQFAALQPGVVLPVRVDPDRPDRVVIDTSGERGTPVDEPAASGGPSAAGRPVSRSYAAADIIAHGVETIGTLGPITPTGTTAGQLVEGLPPHEADDPVVQMAFSYLGPGAETLHTEALIRVPDGKAALLVTGRQVPVRYLPERPDLATIDWDRL